MQWLLLTAINNLDWTRAAQEVAKYIDSGKSSAITMGYHEYAMYQGAAPVRGGAKAAAAIAYIVGHSRVRNVELKAGHSHGHDKIRTAGMRDIAAQLPGSA